MNPEPTWKVGELAARTGLTVRTLHHYDAIGLLSPTGRTGPAHGSGHRLYTAADLARLHQILCLKQLGFGLEQVKEFLTRPDYDPREVVRLHLESVRKRAAELAELGDRLRGLSEVLDREGEASPETFLQTIEAMTMIEKYYTPEQLKQLEERRAAGGEAMDAGVEPSNPNAQELAKRWFALVAAFTGGDPGIFKSLQTMYQNEDRVSGMDAAAMRPMMDYVQRAADAAGIKHAGQ
jgi:DNA-binding transcriptional MerR regulator